MSKSRIQEVNIREPDDGLIECLETLLDHAKSGELTGIYEKGRRHHHNGGKARPVKHVKGDRCNRQHNPDPIVVTLGDVIS